MDTSAAAAAGDGKRCLKKRGRNGHKRLHLRKIAAQSPTMQRQDKRGPKKIAEKWECGKVWPSAKKAQQRLRCRANSGGKALRFTCSQCRDDLEYAPKDLARHFEEKHRGSSPAFSCQECAFNTQEFSSLQVHLLSHKDTFSSCAVCDDNVQRTWPEFSAHLSACHSQNGKYTCGTCHRYSTGDIGAFLEHTYGHGSGLEGASSDLFKDKNQLGPKTSTQALHCKHCGYEASQKWLIVQHVKAVHVCQNGNRRRKKKELHSIAVKPNDPIPKTKPRLTRSAVREMCWLTQDCLSLPGREFLDKYCHLSDPQTTLEETQQFLMKSVTGETGDQKWTKALKTVLSNVPQDVNNHLKSENGIVANSSDLAVLTVKNKITVAQRGAAYGKRLKRTPSSDKETAFSESSADNARGVVDLNGCQPDLSAPTETESKLHNNVLMLPHSEVSQCTQMQENRENQELKTDEEVEEDGKKLQEPMREEAVTISGELKLTNESTEQISAHKVPPKSKRQKRRRKRKAASKKMDKSFPGLPLKIVLKKNPVKGKQWVSQSSLSPVGGGPLGDHPGGPETTAQCLLTDVQQKKWTKAPKMDPSDPGEGAASVLQSKLGEGLAPDLDAAKPMGSKNVAENGPEALDTSNCQEVRAEMEADRRRPSPLQPSGSAADCRVSDTEKRSAADKVTPHRSCSKSPRHVITPPGEVSLEDSGLPGPETEGPADSSPDLLSSSRLPVRRSAQPASGLGWRPVPKTQERTLKLVAINSSQLVKRPVGNQPVVVLNHPDADIPEVARIMEVVNRYRGEVQKVMLSRKTLKALSATSGNVPETEEPADVPPDSSGLGHSSVQERFILKMKLRRLSRKKYEVVGAVSPGRRKFRCWFCGRIFECQEMWMIHRQRHLMEWKRPNCENFNVVHTG